MHIKNFPNPLHQVSTFRWMLWTISDINILFLCNCVSLVSLLLSNDVLVIFCLYLFVEMSFCVTSLLFKLFEHHRQENQELHVIRFCGLVLSINHENKMSLLVLRAFPSVSYYCKLYHFNLCHCSSPELKAQVSSSEFFWSLVLLSSVRLAVCLSSVCKLFTFSSSLEPRGQFQPNLAQSIGMKGNQLCSIEGPFSKGR